MAIYRGSGGSVESITESGVVTIAISQGGTGARTAADARTNLGLGTAATTAASAYATAAQGVLADSAVQPADLGAAATSNSYDDLDDLPTLGTASAQDVGYFATAAQGALADSATQPGDLATVATTGAYSDLTGKPTVPTNLDSLTDVVITSASTDQLLKYNGTNWVNATVGGTGTVTSVDMSVPTGLSVSGNPVTTTGTLAVTYSAGYAIPTTAKQTEWDTAYTDRNKWDGGSTGLDASTGRTSLGLGTAATTAATAYATAAQGSNADTAYGWGNHASAGYAADSAVVHDTGDETIAGLKTFSTGIVLGRVNSSDEGGQVDLCRSSDNASAWALDVYGSTSTPSLRFVDNTASVTRMVIDGSGNVGIGTSLPAAALDVSGSVFSTGIFRATVDGTEAVPSIQPGPDNDTGMYRPVSNNIGFSTAGTERVRIDSGGNLLVGTTSNSTSAPGMWGGSYAASSGYGRLNFVKGTASGTGSTSAIVFYYNGSSIGAVNCTSTATAYSTSSDYRLKENIAPMTGALSVVAALKPCTYTWKADGSGGQGFIAHELQAVVPDCVTGEKDAVDADGNPQYQGIDTSFLVATLTAAIQEQQAIIISLKTRVEALEA